MKQAKTLTEKQLKSVLAHCAIRRHAARDRAIVLVSHLAGLRAKEIALLTVSNVLGEHGIRDEFVLMPEQTKGRKARRVFVSSRLRQELAAYLKQAKLRKGCDALFLSQKGSAFSANTMCQLLIRIYEDCGLEGATSHSGRRTLITQLASKGVSVRVLQCLLERALTGANKTDDFHKPISNISDFDRNFRCWSLRLTRMPLDHLD